MKNTADVEVTVEGPWAQTLSRGISSPISPAPTVCALSARKLVQIESELARAERLARENDVLMGRTGKEYVERTYDKGAGRGRKQQAMVDRIQKPQEYINDMRYTEAEKRLREEQEKRQIWIEEDGPASKTLSASIARNKHSGDLDPTVAHLQDEVHLDFDGTALTKTATPEFSDTRSPVGHVSGTARSVSDLNSVEYTDDVQRPRIELDRNLKQGNFRYDREFLLRFMPECKEKPNSLFPLAAFGLDPSDLDSAVSRGRSGRKGGSRPMSSPSSATPHQTSVGASATNSQSADLTASKVPTQVLQASDERVTPSSVPSRVVLSNKNESSRKPLVSNRTRSKRGLKRVERPPPCQLSPLGSNVFVPASTTTRSISPYEVVTNGLPQVDLASSPSVPEEEVKFQKTAEETGALICTHCGTKPLDPIVTICNHLFCHGCIMSELAKNMCCPACQSIVLLRLNF